MKENNLQKKPKSAREYANLFLLDENGKKKDFSNSKNVCLITIGCAETSWILLQEFAGKNITIIDRKSEIDYIETLIKIHKRNDIRVKRIEVETDEAVHSTILKLNMNMFDLIIANPPYGSHSSLSKKIVNKMLENKVAEEMVVLAPPKTFTDSLPYLKEHIKVGRTGEYFDIIATNGVDISLGYFTSTIQNKYKDPYKLMTPKKEMQLYEALLRYNEGREGFWEKEIGNLRNFTEDDTYLFAIPFFTPEQAHAYRLRKGICYEHNFEGKKWPVTDAITHNGFIIKKNYKANFTNWWYGYLKDNNTLLREIANMIYYVASASPSLKVYLKFLPRVDWSKSWTDEEILKEIGLPEDFLGEKKECLI